MNSSISQVAPDPRWTSRLYENDADLNPILVMLMEARAQSDDWRYWHLGEFLFSFFYDRLPFESARTDPPLAYHRWQANRLCHVR